MKLNEIYEQVLSEGLEDLNRFETDLYHEGRKFYKKLSFRKMPNKITGEESIRVFKNYSRNKGSYSVMKFKHELIDVKIRKTIEWLGKNLIGDLNFSKSTHSTYFTYKGKNIRMSDHKKNDFNGIDILINWDTTSQEIVNQFKT